MKMIYFFTINDSAILDISPGDLEPPFVARRELQAGEGVYLQRYVLRGSEIVDRFPGVSDAVAAGNIMAEAAVTPVYAPPFSPTLSPVEFKMRFTTQERLAIYASLDPVVKDFLSLMDDPRLQSVNKFIPTTQDGMAYLVSEGLLTEARKTEILNW